MSIEELPKLDDLSSTQDSNPGNDLPEESEGLPQPVLAKSSLPEIGKNSELADLDKLAEDKEREARRGGQLDRQQERARQLDRMSATQRYLPLGNIIDPRSIPLLWWVVLFLMLIAVGAVLGVSLYYWL